MNAPSQDILIDRKGQGRGVSEQLKVRFGEILCPKEFWLDPVGKRAVKDFKIECNLDYFFPVVYGII